jgi:hypothetical protein
MWLIHFIWAFYMVGAIRNSCRCCFICFLFSCFFIFIGAVATFVFAIFFWVLMIFGLFYHSIIFISIFAFSIILPIFGELYSLFWIFLLSFSKNLSLLFLHLETEIFFELNTSHFFYSIPHFR